MQISIFVGYAGMIGTIRPTHYHVLFDEVGFSVDDRQELVHSLLMHTRQAQLRFMYIVLIYCKLLYFLKYMFYMCSTQP
jgi:hypothetical protein